ncbi:B3 domain-containing transcription factor VRN1-like [Papaver somniferum]|uniref:B3 domain-containing transcription factor VRN1-like n=1 Tax=Papaver somniferum TaxID=3469 RepID=UPI000E6FF7A1|nr:B3 domain-containing transcription factor VRN1-like [Papaver somniferum]
MSSKYDQSSKKRKKMESSSSTSSSPLHFFKIILNHTIEYKRLEIPKEFLKKFGKELSDCATIEVPSGSVWPVGLTKRRGAISFEEGLKEFMEFYSISVGYFLVFRYEGDSTFHVLIFNISATEIEYPMHNFRNNFKDKAQVIDIDSCNSDSNNETRSQTESLSSRGGHVNLKTEPADDHAFPKQRKVFANTLTTRRSTTSRVTQSKALAAAREFKSEKPFFIAVLPASCVKTRHVNVPAAFKHPCLHQKTTFINLRVAGRKSWDVKLIFLKKHQRSYLSEGWMKFISDNQLKPGDVCVFELVDSKKILMNVHIFRDSQETSSSQKLKTNAPQEARSKENSLVSAEAFKSRKPYFKNVPAAFAVPYLKHEIKVRLSSMGGKTWEMQCNLLHESDRHRAKLFKGWDKFVLDNHLKEGDICVFELYDIEKASR